MTIATGLCILYYCGTVFYGSDMVSGTVGLSYDPTVTLMTPLLDQCTHGSKLLSATTAAIHIRQFSFLRHETKKAHFVFGVLGSCDFSVECYGMLRRCAGVKWHSDCC